MFRFEHPEFLYALLVIPMAIGLYLYERYWRKNRIARFGEHPLMARLMQDVSIGKPLFKLILFILAYSSLVVGIANPQLGSKLEEVKKEGVDLIIALDLSNSMLAEDLSPNRLERAKRAISQLVDRLHSDRIGIVVFGGEAYVQLPITTDYSAAKLFLNSINTNMIPTQGTAIGKAISLSLESFDPESQTGKAIIVITDGENHEDDAIAAATAAKEQGVTVHTIGMGSQNGSPIPVLARNGQKEFMKDREGHTVVTKLNEQMLQEIAGSGGGTYIRATNADAGLNHLLEKISGMEKAEYGSKVFTDYEDRFQYFIAFTLFILILDFFISTRKSAWLSGLNPFKDL